MPGEHTIIVGGLSDALKARSNGLHLRDTLTILLPDARALTAFLFRQPLEGTVAQNVVKHKCGGINIDACRVTHAGVEDFTEHKAMIVRLKEHKYARQFWKNGSNIAGTNEATTSGRWPPNLLLVHGPECVQVGETRVRSSGGDKPTPKVSRNTYGQDAYTKHKMVRSTVTYAGLETVAAWDCQPDCPVKMLDAMSGTLKSGSHKPYTQAVKGWKNSCDVNTFNNEGDTGTASRFFPQFACLDDALAWLGRLTGQTV